MAVIAVVAADDEARERLRAAVEELGHRAAAVPDLKAGLELLSTDRPRLMVVAQGPEDRTAESALFELEREAPLMPVVVAMTKRSASKAVELLKLGVFEVVAPPWTPENLSACLSKALRFKGTSIAVARPAERTRPLWAAAAAVLVLLGAAGLAAVVRNRLPLSREAEKPAPKTEWALPYSHPAGLAYDGSAFWISDWYSRSVWRHEPADLGVSRSFHFPSEVPGALAFAGDALWVSAGPNLLVKHMLDDRLSAIDRVRDPAHQSVGLAYDGLYLWSIDNKAGRIHKRILDEKLSVVASYRYPGGKPAALCWAQGALWSIDSADREILRHDPRDPAVVTKRVPLPRYRSGDWTPTGLAFDGSRFWTTAETRKIGGGPGALFVHEPP